MKLEHISYEVCPACGAPAVAETKDRRHCNGQWNESRRFACGCCVEYSPNFKKENVVVKCPKDPEVIALKQKREMARARLEKYVSRLDVDASFKRRVLDKIQYV